jgi:predicted short-subunit dehydrogenase-like oxidoreductase (DUF2520 family)
MYKISIWGTGNVAYRMAIALKASWHSIPYICGRNKESGEKLVHIINKNEDNSHNNFQKSYYTEDYSLLQNSDVVILAVSDDSIRSLAEQFSSLKFDDLRGPLLLHTSGASPMSLLDCYPFYGVLYPLMTLSKVKPVDFRLIPFMVESSDPISEKIIADIVYSLGAEHRVASSDERLIIHLAAVYVSNFINYLIGLAFDLSTPNQVLLMPLAIETVRKAFLYEHPSLVQTGPAIRKDMKTLKKHLELLDGLPEHKEIYEVISRLISEQNK